jgi:hypothetical protein
LRYRNSPGALKRTSSRTPGRTMRSTTRTSWCRLCPPQRASCTTPTKPTTNTNTSASTGTPARSSSVGNSRTAAASRTPSAAYARPRLWRSHDWRRVHCQAVDRLDTDLRRRSLAAPYRGPRLIPLFHFSLCHLLCLSLARVTSFGYRLRCGLRHILGGDDNENPPEEPALLEEIKQRPEEEPKPQEPDQKITIFRRNSAKVVVMVAHRWTL